SYKTDKRVTSVPRRGEASGRACTGGTLGEGGPYSTFVVYPTCEEGRSVGCCRHRLNTQAPSQVIGHGPVLPQGCSEGSGAGEGNRKRPFRLRSTRRLPLLE